jgi:hypothetical protein
MVRSPERACSSSRERRLGPTCRERARPRGNSQHCAPSNTEPIAQCATSASLGGTPGDGQEGRRGAQGDDRVVAGPPLAETGLPWSCWVAIHRAEARAPSGTEASGLWIDGSDLADLAWEQRPENETATERRRRGPRSRKRARTPTRTRNRCLTDVECRRRPPSCLPGSRFPAEA